MENLNVFNIAFKKKRFLDVFFQKMLKCYAIKMNVTQ